MQEASIRMEEPSVPQGAPADAGPTVSVLPVSEQVRWTALGVAVAVSVVASAVFDVPSRPVVLIWIIAVVGAASWRSPHRVGRVVWAWLPILVIAAGYDLVRSRAPDLVPRAVTEPQLRFDEIAFGGTAPTVLLQDALVDRGTPHWWDYAAWCMYLSHFVFTPTIALWLYLRHREWFHRFAVLILTVSLCGFVTYFILPAIPPWLASRNGDLEPTTRIVHAVWANLGFTGAAKVFAGDAKLANPVAALPSLHAAWPFMTLLFLWRKVGRWRWAIVAYNAVMVLVLVYGAEHYLSDILLGWLYAAVVYVVVTRVLDHRDARRAIRSNV
jgi:membrane-associated phospholipid phosphatase